MVRDVTKDGATPSPEQTRLDSWKAIAAHLKRDVRTVRRWEKSEGLPVHRHLHQAQSTVYAYASEIDAWAVTRKPRREEAPRWRRPITRLAFAAALILSLLLVADTPFSASAGAAQQAAGQPGVIARQVWTLPEKGDISFGAVSPDGRYIPFEDDGLNGDLFLHDLTAGTDRRLTSGGNIRPGLPQSEQQYAEEWSFSRDGKQLAYNWFVGWKDRYELRVIDLEGSSIPQFRLRCDDPKVKWINPQDWSPDGKWIAAFFSRSDGPGQIALLSEQDGSLRVLKPLEGHGPSRMFFSPDGKYIAYDLGVDGQHDIFVLATDSGAELAAVTDPSNDVLVGWSPDGTRLLFSSDRGGSTDLWAVGFAGGKIQGSPQLIHRNFGGFSLGITASGSLYTIASTETRADIQVAPFDVARGLMLSSPTLAVPTFVGTNWAPNWSPDGKHLAYVSSRSSSLHVIGIRTVETGQVRELPSGLDRFESLSWAPDGGSFIATGRDFKGVYGIYRIDAQMGQRALMVSGAYRSFASPVLSPDGKTLCYSQMNDLPGAAEFLFVKRDLASGSETELLRRPLLGVNRAPAISLSPDGRYIAAWSGNRLAQSNAFLVIPTAGGEPKEVIRRTQTEILAMFAWDRDSRSFLIRIGTGGDKSELWRAFVDGTPPVKLDTMVDSNIGAVSLHPDGRRIAFAVRAPVTPSEIWVTENLPVLKAAK